MLNSIHAITLHENGVPLHALPTARQKPPSPSSSPSPGESHVFVVDYKEFSTMSAFDIQGIFRHRHILVLNHPQEYSYEFDLRGLHALGHLDSKREMQGKFQGLLTIFIG
jgi:hypothetical protein